MAESPKDPPSQGDEAQGSKGSPGNARAHYSKVFEAMPEEVRVELAGKVEGADLRALCFDPIPRVIHALLKNPACGADHARIIAREHHNGVGLQHLARIPRYLRDQEVRRQLLKNRNSGPQIINKLIENRPLSQIYQSAIDRNVPEQTRMLARSTLKRVWTRREADEKVALIVKTDGRCLAQLVGQGLDGKAASILCSRSAMSTLLIRNLARWPSTPPPLLKHMVGLPAVGRDKSLKQALLRHPNLPSSLKRGL